MRVIAGELRGRRLISPLPGGDETIRPTSDRAREALFSMLGDVAGLEVLDLYCGTGALAIEALSRGAAHATLVDVDMRVARRNVEELGLAERAALVPSDALDFLRSEQGEFALVVCDPPYTLGPLIEAELANLLPSRLSPGGLLAIESAARSPLRIDAAGLEQVRDRRYGAASIQILRAAR